MIYWLSIGDRRRFLTPIDRSMLFTTPQNNSYSQTWSDISFANYSAYRFWMCNWHELFRWENSIQKGMRTIQRLPHWPIDRLPFSISNRELRRTDLHAPKCKTVVPGHIKRTFFVLPVRFTWCCSVNTCKRLRSSDSGRLSRSYLGERGWYDGDTTTFTDSANCFAPLSLYLQIPEKTHLVGFVYEILEYKGRQSFT